jgi:hypothetical protein
VRRELALSCFERRRLCRHRLEPDSVKATVYLEHNGRLKGW